MTDHPIRGASIPIARAVIAATVQAAARVGSTTPAAMLAAMKSQK